MVCHTELVEVFYKPNTTDMEDKLKKTKSIIDEIWIQRNIAAKIYLRYPDFVMLHPKCKRTFEDELQHTTQAVKGKIFKCFGMKVIWSNEIGEADIICTFDGSKNIFP